MEIHLDPTDGSDNNSGALNSPWQTIAKVNLAINAVDNNISRLIFTRKPPVYLTDQFDLGPNASGIVVETATNDYADLRSWKNLDLTGIDYVNSGLYPQVYKCPDTQTSAVLWQNDGPRADSLIWLQKATAVNADASVFEFLQANEGSFYTDGAFMYWHPFGGNPTTPMARSVIRYLSSDPTRPANAIQISGDNITLRGLSVFGTCVADKSSNSPDDAYCIGTLNAGGLTTIEDVRAGYSAKHAIGLIEGKNGAEVLLNRVQVEQGSPYPTITGEQTLLVSFADNPTGLKHTYREVASRANTGLYGSKKGQNSEIFAVFTTHNDNSSATPFSEIQFDRCDFPGQGLDQQLGCIPRGFKITRTRFGKSKFVDATIDKCIIDTDFAVGYEASSVVRLIDTLAAPTGAPSTGNPFTSVKGNYFLDGVTFDLRALQVPFYKAFLIRTGSLSWSMQNSAVISQAFEGQDVSLLQNAAASDAFVCANNAYSGVYNDRIINGYDGTDRTLAQWQTLGFDAGSTLSTLEAQKREVARQMRALPEPTTIASDNAAIGGGTYQITFTVQDADSIAVQGARVELVGTGIWAVSDALGRAVFHLDAGTYTRRIASSRGFSTLPDAPVVVTKDATLNLVLASVGFSLSPDPLKVAFIVDNAALDLPEEAKFTIRLAGSTPVCLAGRITTGFSLTRQTNSTQRVIVNLYPNQTLIDGGHSGIYEFICPDAKSPENRAAKFRVTAPGQNLATQIRAYAAEIS